MKSGQVTLHDSARWPLLEQRSSVVLPSQNGWRYRDRSCGTPAYFCILQVSGLTVLWRVDAEKL